MKFLITAVALPSGRLDLAFKSSFWVRRIHFLLLFEIIFEN